MNVLMKKALSIEASQNEGAHQKPFKHHLPTLTCSWPELSSKLFSISPVKVKQF